MLVGIESVQRRGAAYVLHAAGVELAAGAVDLGAARVLVFGRELDLDQLVIDKRAVDLGDYGFTQPRGTGLDDRFEMVRLFL